MGTKLAECDYPALETRVAAKLAGVRLCSCGCERSLEGRSARCNYYEDRCRAKGYHTRQTANNPGPAKRTPRRQRPTGRKVEPKARRTEPEPAPTPPAPEPRPIKKGKKRTKKETVVYDAEARRQTQEINNVISWSLTELASSCKRCQLPGGPKSKGCAGPLRTKMGKPGALCDDCWAQVYPEEV